MRRNEHRAGIMTSRSSFLPKEPERRISRGYCRDVGPGSPSFVYTLVLRPNPRIRGRPRKEKSLLNKTKLMDRG